MLAILPYRRFVIESPLPHAELEARISRCIERSRWMVYRSVNAPFRGEVEGSNFKLRRIIPYGNGFLPVIVARVEARRDGGSQLIGVMRLAYPTAIFMGVWFGGAIIAGVALGVPALSTPPFSWADFTPEIMLAAGAAMTLGGFLPEAAIALRALKKLATATHREAVMEPPH